MLRLYLGLSLTIIAGGLFGCGEPPAASNGALGAALELPTGVLTGSTDINLPTALDEPLPSGVTAAFIHRNDVDLLILTGSWSSRADHRRRTRGRNLGRRHPPSV